MFCNPSQDKIVFYAPSHGPSDTQHAATHTGANPTNNRRPVSNTMSTIVQCLMYQPVCAYARTLDSLDTDTMDGEEEQGSGGGAEVTGPAPSTVVVTIWLDATEEAAFDAASNTETLPRLFTGSGLVPGVESAHMEDGEGGIGVGRVRVVTTSDGKTVRETYTEVDRPSRYAYEMTELNMPLAAIMTHAVGEWDFVAEAGGTRVTWTYYAFPRNVLARPATALLTKGFLKSAMNGYLANLKTQLELELPPVWEPDTSAPGCSLCKTEFSFFTRRHHCRACGALVCAECSPSKTPLPHFGINKPVRVCRECNPDTPDPLSAASASIADDDL